MIPIGIYNDKNMKTLITKMLGIYLNALALVAPRKAGHLGFLVFCRPFKTTINERQKVFFNTAEKFSIDHNDTMIQGYRWGSGSKKILFLHGWQSHTYRWKSYIDALSKEEYTIYSLDAPGHGQSGGNFLSVPVYSSLIQNFINDIGEVHAAVGHSLGGFSLLYSFYQQPLLAVKKIILMAPPGEATDFMNFYKKTLKLSDRTMKFVIEHFTQTYQVGPDYFSSKKFAASVKIDGLIIHDEKDAEAPFQYAKDIQSVWKRSKLITTTGIGHNLKSPKVVKEIVSYIENNAHDMANNPITTIHS